MGEEVYTKISERKAAFYLSFPLLRRAAAFTMTAASQNISLRFYFAAAMAVV